MKKDLNNKYFKKILVLLIGIFLGINTASAATITVTTTTDELNVNSQCSLREAITNINNGATIYNDCVPSGTYGESDTIIVPEGEYIISIGGIREDNNETGDFDITSSLSIVGAGAKKTIINANNKDRVFHILSGTVSISGVMIKNGLISWPGAWNGGGGILNQSTLTITNSIISNNVLHGDATCGGGIYNGGTLFITDSTITGNVATGWWGCGGGGIYNGGTLSVNNLTIYKNSEFGYSNHGGGGILNNGTANISNSTIVRNESRNGWNYSGGIYNMGSLTITNTIVANQVSGSDCDGDPISSNGYNIESRTSCGFTNTGDMQNKDPLIGPLQDNGGPTLTAALLLGSPAIDAGNPLNCPSTDQRGFFRPIDGDSDGNAICDIGAFEYGELVKYYSYFPGTGHWYEPVYVPGGITWDAAKVAAEAEGGYLATITSAEENNFVFGLVNDPAYFIEIYGPYIGGFQPAGSEEPAGGWTWVTGEPWVYTNWNEGEPNNYLGIENALHLLSNVRWNDLRTDESMKGYIIEYNCLPTPSGMVSWWKAENNALDVAGSSNGILMNGATFAQGLVGQAFSFDGEDDYVVVGNSSSLKPSQFTIDAWVKINGFPSQFNTVISHGSMTGSENSYFLGFSTSGILQFFTFHNEIGHDQLNAPNPVSTNEWHHIAGTFDGTTKKIYIDGVLVASKIISRPIVYDNSPVLIGQDLDNGMPSGNIFYGLIDELEIFNRALTAGEIQAIYTSGSSGKCIVKRNLTVTKSGTGSGVVTSNPSGIDCGTDCNEQYMNVTNITLTATPDSSSIFTGWTSGTGSSSRCTGTGNCSFTITEDSTITAEFTLKQYTITTDSSPSGSGDIVCTPNPVNHGTQSTCTITPSVGYTIQ
ncbi:MAG: CSLREA domain-containing protein, partial [Proteobacteria bacterium]|nr:CSLREA domain-containing protein [Pseudomonadota bacterium]